MPRFERSHYFLLAIAITSIFVLGWVSLAAWNLTGDSAYVLNATPTSYSPAQDDQADGEPDQIDPAVFAERQKEFDRIHSEWKTKMKEMFKIRLSYLTCSANEAAGLNEDWNRTQGEAEELIQELKVVGMDIYRYSSEKDNGLAEFLTNMMERDARADRYESVYQIGLALGDKTEQNPELWEPMGLSAFATHRFEEADFWFRRDAAMHPEDERITSRLEVLEIYKDEWARELRLRERDEQSGDLPQVRIETSKGEIIVELFEDDAPNTVANFISLVEGQFYDGLKFHRVIGGFMAQTGCPFGNGYGNPGYNIKCECYEDEIRKHWGGVLSMANGGRDTGGSQFYITFLPTPHLDGLHTVFGRIIKGQEILADLRRVDNENPETSTGDPDTILKATVIRKRDHEYKPETIAPRR